MPSARKQFNCRPDEETWDRIPRLKELARRLLDLKLSDGELLRLALLALERDLAAKVAAMGGDEPGAKGRPRR
jgi:hypothetical protein